MRVRAVARLLLVPGLLLAPPLATSAAAQRTADQARLVFNVSAAYIGGKALWRVAGQPIVDNPAPGFTLTDVVRLERRIRPNFGAALSGFYFPSDNFGFGAEAFLIGLGFEDACTIASASGSTRNAEICDALDGRDIGATSVALAGSAIYRVNSRGTISPYIRGNAGFLISTQSSVRMRTEVLVPTPNPFDPPDATEVAEIEVYPDETNTDVFPTFAAALGMTAALSPGYQLRWEVRDNVVFMREVSGSTERQDVEPPTERRLQHLFSIAIGIDIVLERRGGRR
jgi:hypothetical protein